MGVDSDSVKILSHGALAPVLLFCYDRLDNLRETINELKKNHLANHTPLIIYSDGPKSHNKKNVEEVREFLHDVNGFLSVTIVENSSNLGLANSVIKGVTEVLEKYDRVIVLEDDIVTNRFFLSYMNSALFEHSENEKISSITGFNYNLNVSEDISCFLYPRSSSKSWATWRRAWNNIEFNIDKLISKWGREKVNKDISKFGDDLPLLLSMQENNKVDSWAIRFCINQIMNDCYTLYPNRSYVKDIGDDSGTHACLNLPHNVFYAEKVLTSVNAKYYDVIHHKYQNYLKWHSRKEFFYRVYRKLQMVFK
ncbi:glycosyltransferase [Vibrio furnissii]|uniref:glycosyltransferase n=1 Tax=Vibrio furnissii TaxID=29494 RepID=UPI0013029119|nr:glycosyltransferase [Vibrio furnissii]